MKIIGITTKLNFVTSGGSIGEIDLTYRTLQKLGHDLTVITAFSNANNMPEPLPYTVVEEQFTSSHLLGIMWQCYRLLKTYEAQADVFHLDGQVFLYGAGLYRRLGGRIPISTYFNRELSSWPENVSSFSSAKHDPWWRRIKKKLRWYVEKYLGIPLANAIDWMSFASPVLQKAYENFGLKTANKAMILGDPLDYKKLMEEQGLTEMTYQQRNKSAGVLVLFYSGRMTPGKGFDFLLKAFAQLRHKERFHLILGGKGQEEQNIRQMAKDLELEPYVEFPGWVTKSQVYENFKRTDIFIHARWRTELTSVTLLEAMTFGLPSVLPGGGGIKWVAKDSALYYTDIDYHDLARQIERLGDDFNLRSKISRNCYVRLAEDEMNHELTIAQLAAGMERIIKQEK
ncbi:MAG: hypothetical protein UX10_C0006G0022 [Candidatus Magasanikbacteria bacterium GW2011_GWA2_45_39]|uniref:Uncharacterized protein n=1 Tax=Candidatus Magasanikbacteria bacterium GW2011_GWA2_45_39 TaxID=1619041 RepID=A0A0G1MHA8_9BACT|nr:MAG: hypothetical protein UX10_C0006G0022 [Candidatus Magasanikbacteria bacterium GW2011_GWA2_45_39]